MPRSIFDAYVSGGAREFFAGAFASAADRRRAVERAERPLEAPVLAALAAQNARFAPSDARSAQLAALAEGAAAVVTGQQVGLFLGPLYTVYKAATAIRAAQALATESGRPVVPVFWLQTEDHDLPEIASCAIPRAQQEPLTLRMACPPENRVSVAHVALPDEISACHATLEAELGKLPHARVHLERLARHYRPGAGYADAFAGLLAELFEPEGLILIDPRDPALAPATAAVHRRALDSAQALSQALLERSAALERAGFAAAVHVRADAPLSFFHPGGGQAPRHRLVRGEQGFAEVGGEGTHTRDGLLAALERDPLCFSTSALLRPIVQDTLLPTAVYVGGPGEIAYLAQLGPLYEAFGLQPPLVLPRARLRVVEAGTARLLERLGLDSARAEQGEDVLLAELARTGAADPAPLTPEAFERTLADGFERVLAQAVGALPPLGDQLQAALEKTRANVRMAASKLAEKYAGVLARRDEGRVQELQRLRTLLQPGGVPQERFYGLPYFAARYGERAFLERVLSAIEPFDPTPRELRP